MGEKRPRGSAKHPKGNMFAFRMQKKIDRRGQWECVIICSYLNI